MERPYIYNHSASLMYEALGIPEERALKLVEIAKRIIEDEPGLKTSRVLERVWNYCNTPGEISFVVFCAGMTVGHGKAVTDFINASYIPQTMN